MSKDDKPPQDPEDAPESPPAEDVESPAEHPEAPEAVNGDPEDPRNVFREIADLTEEPPQAERLQLAARVLDALRDMLGVTIVPQIDLANAEPVGHGGGKVLLPAKFSLGALPDPS